MMPAPLSDHAPVPPPAYHRTQQRLGPRLEIDALALVRRLLWTSLLFQTSPLVLDTKKISGALLDHLRHAHAGDVVCRAGIV